MVRGKRRALLPRDENLEPAQARSTLNAVNSRELQDDLALMGPPAFQSDWLRSVAGNFQEHTLQLLEAGRKIG
jgi:hypothetical protein